MRQTATVVGGLAAPPPPGAQVRLLSHVRIVLNRYLRVSGDAKMPARGIRWKGPTQWTTRANLTVTPPGPCKVKAPAGAGQSNSTRVPSVFISHASGDGARPAVLLDRWLRQHGLDTWLGSRDLDCSRDFTAALEEAIRAANVFVVCITGDVLRSDSFVRREILYAQGCDKPIAVARFARLLPPISVVANTYFDFYRDWDAACMRLLAYISAKSSTVHDESRS